VLPKIQAEYKHAGTFHQPNFVCIHQVCAAFFGHINTCNTHLAFYVSYYILNVITLHSYFCVFI